MTNSNPPEPPAGSSPGPDPWVQPPRLISSRPGRRRKHSPVSSSPGEPHHPARRILASSFRRPVHPMVPSSSVLLVCRPDSRRHRAATTRCG